jgi:hypothetical protein
VDFTIHDTRTRRSRSLAKGVPALREILIGGHGGMFGATSKFGPAPIVVIVEPPPDV